MSPDTEWMQPVRPMRVLFKTSETDRHYVYIFAIHIIDEYKMEYMTIDGICISALSKSVMYAEIFIDGEWTMLG
jgi:hypothetical protein